MIKIGATRAFLKREGFEFSLQPGQLDRKFRRALSPEKVEMFELAGLMPDCGERSKLIYSLPDDLQQAHLLFSHDSARTAISFAWLASFATETEGPILDLGCGSGAFARLLAAHGKSQPIVGIDEAANLVAIAKKASREWRTLK